MTQDFTIQDLARESLAELKSVVQQHVERTAAAREAEFLKILQDVERRLAALEAKVKG